MAQIKIYVTLNVPEEYVEHWEAMGTEGLIEMYANEMAEGLTNRL